MTLYEQAVFCPVVVHCSSHGLNTRQKVRYSDDRLQFMVQAMHIPFIGLYLYDCFMFKQWWYPKFYTMVPTYTTNVGYSFLHQCKPKTVIYVMFFASLCSTIKNLTSPIFKSSMQISFENLHDIFFTPQNIVKILRRQIFSKDGYLLSLWNISQHK